MTGSFRTWLRSVKDITDDGDLFTAVKAYDKTIKTKTSGVRALQELVCKIIPDLSEKTTIEMYKILNVLVPAVSTDSTTQNVYVQLRKCIKAQWGDDSDVTHKGYFVMRFDQQKWRAARAEYNAKVVEKNNHKRQFDEDKVYSVMDKIANMTAPDHVDLAIALQLASGGRISEILSFATFKPADKKQHITQTGILKSKVRTTITKPVIHFTVPVFMEMLKTLRLKLVAEIRNIKQGKMTHYQLSQDNNSKINRRISKYFEEHVASHSLRKIYAALAYRDFADKTKVSETAYLSDILGHAEDSLDVSTSYSTVSVVRNEDAEPEEPEPEDPKDMAVPRNLKVRDGQAGERLAETVRIMELKNMPVNNKALRSFGYGSNTVREFLQTYQH
jgi:integrase